MALSGSLDTPENKTVAPLRRAALGYGRDDGDDYFFFFALSALLEAPMVLTSS